MKNNSGQAILVILLVMAALATAVISTVSRSITDIAVTEKEEEALRAFSAAEAGIEQGLLDATIGTILTDDGRLGDSQFSATVSDIKEAPGEFIIKQSLASGNSATVWLVEHDSNGQITCSGGGCFTGNELKFCGDSTAAVEVSIVYITSPGFSSARIARMAADPDSTRRGSNQFESVEGGETIAGKSFSWCKNVSFGSLGIPIRIDATSPVGAQFARVKALYNPTASSFGVKATSNLPSQGVRVESVGTSGPATRKVVVNRSHPDLPPIFDFGLFSGTEGLVK